MTLIRVDTLRINWTTVPLFLSLSLFLCLLFIQFSLFPFSFFLFSSVIMYSDSMRISERMHQSNRTLYYSIRSKEKNFFGKVFILKSIGGWSKYWFLQYCIQKIESGKYKYRWKKEEIESLSVRTCWYFGKNEKRMLKKKLDLWLEWARESIGNNWLERKYFRGLGLKKCY